MSSSPYHNAGILLSEHVEKRRGIKSIAFEATSSSLRGGGGKKKKSPPDKSTYATVCKTIQHIPIINMILDTPNINLRKAIGFDTVRNKGLLYVMLYELLFGPYKSIRGGGKIKRMIIKYENELRSEADRCLTTTSVGRNLMDNGNRSIGNFPRYVRVNTLRTTVVDVVDILRRELKTKYATTTKEADDSSSSTKNTTAVSEISDIYVDAHVPDLLVLPPTASSWLHRDYELVQSGKIVLQDKSSCFSALVLMNGLGDGLAIDDDDKSIPSFDYIDACSAPGNKTSHLAALVHNSSIINDGDEIMQRKKQKKTKKGKTTPKSTIFAFERASTRFNTLEQRTKQLIPSSSDKDKNCTTNVVVDPIHGDFLKADPTDPKFINVRAIMLDPSCSGSGIINSPDRWMDDNTNGDDDDDDDNNNNNKDAKRIQSLSNFQLVALKHAMSFPNVDKIVYSTCSVHDDENEIVIAKALREVEKSNCDDNDWALVAPTCLEHWSRRGREVGGLTKGQADCLIRCDGLDGDETNGFFVAFLVRKKKLVLAERTATTTIILQAKVIEYSISIPTYKGQFVDLFKSRTSVPASATSDPKQSLLSNNDSRPDPTKLTNQAGKTKQHDNKLSCTKLNAKSEKKREKKMAWKRNQALLKSSRLKKKEGGVVAPTATLKDA